jgi:hypothetical protein
MTLREADEVAQKRLPVVYKGIEYLRIIQTGYNYDENGRRHGFVQLLDKCNHSVMYADPSGVSVKE